MYMEAMVLRDSTDVAVMAVTIYYLEGTIKLATTLS